MDRLPSMLTPHIPTFYVPSHRYPEYLHSLLLMALGSIFGGIHCAGWNFSFPRTEALACASSGYHHNPDCCTHLHFYHALHHPCQCWCSSPICVNFLHLHACICICQACTPWTHCGTLEAPVRQCIHRPWLDQVLSSHLMIIQCCHQPKNWPLTHCFWYTCLYCTIGQYLFLCALLVGWCSIFHPYAYLTI